MKHTKAKGALSILAALLLTAALAAVYADIGLRSDIHYVRQLCVQRVDNLTASIAELMDAEMSATDEQGEILHNYMRLSVLPLRDAVRQSGDDAIQTHGGDCVVRLDGDRVIVPGDADVPPLAMSSTLEIPQATATPQSRFACQLPLHRGAYSGAIIASPV